MPAPDTGTAALSFEAQVLVRLKGHDEKLAGLTDALHDVQADIRSNHEATIQALEGRTRLIEKTLDGGKWLASKVLEPTRNFLILIALLTVASGAIGVAQVWELVWGPAVAEELEP